MGLAENSSGLWSLVDLADDTLRSKQEPSKAPKALLDLSDGFPERMSKAVGGRLDRATLDELMSMPDLDFIVHRWGRWGDAARIRQVFEPMLADDDKLAALLNKFVRTGTMQSGNKVSETYQLSMKPLAAAMDLEALAPRVNGLLSRPNLTERQRAMVRRFNQGMKAIAQGKDPDGMHFDDDDE